MRSGWRWVGPAAVAAAIAIGVACGGAGSEDHSQQAVGGVVAGSGPGSSNGRDAGPTDAGPYDGPPDAGPADAGPDGGPADAGPADAGPADGGTPLKNVVFPTTANWDFYGPQNGGPQDVLDVAMDEGGNLWVASNSQIVRVNPALAPKAVVSF